MDRGQRVGNYILIEKAGQGGFAEVWKAEHHERRGRVVAVKIATDPDYARQLRREVRLPIEHPRIAPVIDSDTRGKWPYLVMPWYSGGSLAALIAQHPRGLPEERIGQILRDILEGLAAAHAAGVVHRDLKPSNVLLDEGGRALLSDFGLADAAEALLAAESILISASVERQRQTIRGTPAYMAPEVRQGSPATPSADVYAVGLILFEMVAGRQPTGLELPCEKRTDLSSPDLWNALYWWASRPPEERYGDAAAMLEALRAGPRPVPLGPQAAASAAVSIPEPTPLPAEPWEALRTCRRDLIDLLGRLKALEKPIAEALELYDEHHPEVRRLRAEQQALRQALAQRVESLSAAAKRIQAGLEQQRALLEQRRAALLAGGLRPKHPDVRAIDSQIERLGQTVEGARELAQLAQAEISAMQAQAEGLSAGNLLWQCAEAWDRALEDNVAGPCREFLERFEALAGVPWITEAYNRLGEFYAKGFGVSQDYAEAVKWYRKAAEQGNAYGRYWLGRSYAEGKGVAQDYAEAVKWFRAAAEQGHAGAQNWLGSCYFNARGLPRDSGEAVKWFRKAAEHGLADAQCNLGLCYHSGHGVAQDYGEAVKWFRKAAEQGYAVAQNNLGWCYANGQGVAQDYGEAVKWYRKAAEQGDADAQFNLGCCYEKGKGVARDYAEAVKWYRKAADQWHARAREKLAANKGCVTAIVAATVVLGAIASCAWALLG